MFLRLFAIAVFALVVGPAAPVKADDFAKRYIVANPPRPVPAFTFEDKQGLPHTIKEYRGRYVLLNLWATWCAPCVQEMPSLNTLQTQFDFRDLNVVALSEDRNGVTAAEIFNTRYSLKNLPVYADASGQAPSLLHAHGLPTTLLIDPQGMEIGRIEGEAAWSAPETLTFLKSKMKLSP